MPIINDLFQFPDFTATYHNHSYPAIAPTRPELSAAGKTVFISGGGRGLGTSIVQAFATAGATHIIILGRNAETLQDVRAGTEAAHPSTKVTVVAGDVTQEQDVARAFAEARKVSPHGGVDIAVANAGYLPAVELVPPTEQSGDAGFTADWWRAWEVNVKGVFLQARSFLASAKPDAVFINVSAAAAHMNPPLPAFSPYAGSKIGSARVVETLQLENPGFRFYNVQPGVIQTDMLVKSGLATLEVVRDERKSCL